MTSPHAIDREEVMAYLDGELPAERLAIVRRHLDTCESCRALAADLRQVSARLSEWQVEASPAVLDVTVRAALEASPLVSGSPGSPRSRWQAFFVLPVVRFAGLTAAAASLIFAGWMIVRPGNEPDMAAVPVAQITAPMAAPDARAQLEQPVATPMREQPLPGAERERSSRASRGVSPPAGFTAAQPRMDAISEVNVTQQGQGQRGAPPATAPPAITNPPLSAPVPVSPPPPAPPPAGAAPPPPATQTAGVARSDIGEQRGAGAGGRGGGGGGAARSITVDASRNAMTLVEVLPGAANRPLIARRAELTIVTTRFDQARADFDRLVTDHQAIPTTLKTSGDTGQTRAIDAVIRIPVERFDAAIKSLRALGRVTRETQASDQLEIQMMALSSKLAAVQDQLVRQRDVRDSGLTTEQALARAREDQVRLETELRTLYGRVTSGELTIRIEESREGNHHVDHGAHVERRSASPRPVLIVLRVPTCAAQKKPTPCSVDLGDHGDQGDQGDQGEHDVADERRRVAS